MKENKSVLIVEDDGKMLDSIVRGLESSSRFTFEIQRVMNPRDYVCKGMARRRFDICVIDLNLSQVVQFPQGFRIVFGSIAEHPGSLAIVYSGYPTPPNIVKAMRLGAADFVSKAEFPPHELVKYIEDLFDEQHRAWERQTQLEQLTQAKALEWQKQYSGQYIVLVGEEVVTTGASKIEAILNYDDLRVDRREWPETPDIIEVPGKA